MDRSRLPTSPTTMTSNDICSDIIIEILSCLPVDSLLRFKSVCKSWLSLITNPRFVIKLHMGQSNATVLFTTNKGYAMKSIDEVLVVSSSSSIIEKYEIVNLFDFPQRYVDVVGSCNGLICLHAYDRSSHKYYYGPSDTDRRSNNILCLWNPSTKEFKLLPSLVESEGHHVNATPRKPYSFKTFRYGFGYDHVVNDYKVIATSRYGYEDNRFIDGRFFFRDSEVVMVYTLGTNSWRRIQCNKPFKFELHSVFSTRYTFTKTWTYVNGAFHRIVPSSSSIYSIISFDIVDEVYREVPNPECVDSRSMHLWDLSVLRGCLCVSTHSKSSTDKYMEVWMMVDYGVKESWTKLFNITSNVADISHFRPVWLHKNGEVMVGNSEFVIYDDPKHNQVKRLKPWSSNDSWFETEIYTGSLVSLKSYDELNRSINQRTEVLGKHMNTGGLVGCDL